MIFGIKISSVCVKFPISIRFYLSVKTMSGNLCQYLGCSNAKKLNPEIMFHRFPAKKDPERAATWITNSGENFI